MIKQFLAMVFLILFFSGNSYANSLSDIFKSSIERCADDKIIMSDIVASKVFKVVERTKDDPVDPVNPNKKLIKVRDIPESEQLIEFEKFLKQKLKKKLDTPEYVDVFKDCTKLKKESPELFKAKYSLF